MSMSIMCDYFCLAQIRENILKTAKALVEDTKLLVAGAASSQERLAQAAQSSAKTITHLTDVVKLGAASMGSDDPETQVCGRSEFFSLGCMAFELFCISRSSASFFCLNQGLSNLSLYLFIYLILFNLI